MKRSPRIYQKLTEIQLGKFLKSIGIEIDSIQTVELKEPDFGDYIVAGGYKFKKVYSEYLCMETPTVKHSPINVYFTKAPNDILKK